MGDKLRIVIDARKWSDFGIGTHIRGLVRSLAKLESELEMALILDSGDVEDVDVDAEILRSKSSGYSAGELFEIGRLADAAGADLLHVPHYVVPFGSRPLSVTIHDTIHLQLPRTEISVPARGYARLMLGRAIRKADAIFTPTNAVRDDLARRWSGSVSKMVVTPNAVSPSLLDAQIGTIPPGLEQSSFLLFVGNEKPHKNVARLSKAFARVRETRPQLQLVLVGGAFDSIEQEGVTRLGRVDESMLRALYTSATLLVQPSTLEGFGLPVIEAMAHGCPVVVSDIPALVEVAGEETHRFDPESVDQIADVIASSLENREWLASERERGPVRAASFSWDHAAATTLETWQMILR